MSLVKPGERYEKEEQGVYRINPAAKNDYDRLFNRLKSQGKMPGLILHLWNITGPGTSGAALTLAGLEQTLELGLYCLLYMVQSLDRVGIPGNIHLQVLTDHLHAVVGQEGLCPDKAAILGAVRVIPLEYPDISCHALDILLPEPGSPGEDELLGQLLAGFKREFSGGEPPVMALRGPRF